MSEDNGFPGELERYHRQMLLPGFGEAGQRALLNSTVLIVGCGALGTVLASTLARAGVGHLKIIDRDFIETTNLQRQILFDESDVAHAIPKAEAARQKIAGVNSQVRVTAFVDDLNHTNIADLADDCDVLVDGVDNFETRFLVNDTAVKLGVPYVYGGAVGTVGMTYPILPHTPAGDRPWEQAGRATPCLRCIFEQTPPPGMNPTCDTTGVLGPAVNIVASYQAMEAMKILTGNWPALNRRMRHMDVWENSFRQLKVQKAYELGDCICCKQRVFEFLEGKYASATTTLCGRNAVQLTQQVSAGKLDFNEIAGRLRSHGKVDANKFMLRAEIVDNGEPYELTLFHDGRAIVKGTQYPNTAKSIYAKYVGV
jgi:adenylyltransferase/sulfurtransferase